MGNNNKKNNKEQSDIIWVPNEMPSVGKVNWNGNRVEDELRVCTSHVIEAKHFAFEFLFVLEFGITIWLWMGGGGAKTGHNGNYTKV